MLLLDTHAFIWFENEDSRLPYAVLDRIERERNVFVSIASFWEMTIKSSLGKLQMKATITDLMEDCLEYDFSILQINAAHLERLKKLPWIHRDPFDRLIIGQAQEENLTIVTVDSNIVKYDVNTFWE